MKSRKLSATVLVQSVIVSATGGAVVQSVNLAAIVGRVKKLCELLLLQSLKCSATAGAISRIASYCWWSQ